jgi:uncharacterized protein YdhG (YjbR/CyaY superfamily)
MSAMDEYLDSLPQEQREALAQVRAIVERVAPDAEEGGSYGMPAYLYAGRPLLGFRAAKKHLSVFPFSPAAIEAVAVYWQISSGLGRKRWPPGRSS